MQAARVAIDEALRRVYGDRQPAVARERVAPLEQIRIYDHPGAHWHFVTLGLSELDAKVSAAAEVSGWGLELTLRVARAPAETAPPVWPLRALVQLARYVFETRRPFAPNHLINLEGPIDADAPRITGLLFTIDFELGGVDTPNGAVTFVQAVGVLADEIALVERWSVAAFAEVLASRDPLLITEPPRPSLLDDAILGPLLRERASADGMPQANALTSSLTWKESGLLQRTLAIELGPAAVARKSLRQMLQGALAHGRLARVAGPDRELVLRAGATPQWATRGRTVELTVSPPLAAELARFLDGTDRRLVSSVLPRLTLALID